MAGKGIAPAALDGQASILDVAPTIAALQGLSTPDEWEGRSLL